MMKKTFSELLFYKFWSFAGSAIKGNKIDLAFDNRGQALEWGRRRVRVYIL